MCWRDQEHGSLLNGKSARAAVHPDSVCVEILKGMRETFIDNNMNHEMKDDEQSQSMITSLPVDDSAYHVGQPDQWDKPRRGPMGDP